MKHILLIALIVFSIIACSKNEDDPPTNYIDFGEAQFEISNTYYHQDSNIFTVIFGDNALDTSGYIGEHSMLIEFNSLSDTLKEGKYRYNYREPYESYEFEGDLLLFGFQGAFFELDSGEVVVRGSGTNFSFDFDITYNFVRAIKGTYSGQLTEISDSAILDVYRYREFNQ
jgi:hypothetical protein